VSEEHGIPWGFPGPTDPAERARATDYELDGDHYRRVKPVEWWTEGLPDEKEEHTAAQQWLREAWGLPPPGNR
jgi:hypothetical protein